MKRSIILGLTVLFGALSVSSAEAGPIRNLISKLRNRSGCSSCR